MIGTTRQTWWRWLGVAAAVSLLLLLSAGRAWSEEAAPVAVAVTTPAPVDELAAKRAKLAEQIAELTKREEAAPGETAAQPDVSENDEELESLRSLDALYLQHQASLERRRELTAEKSRLAEELEKFRKFGPSEAKPYSFLLLENLRDQLAGEEDRDTATQSDLRSAEQTLDSARDDFDEAESDRRQAHEALEENEEEDKAAELTIELKAAELESKTTEETVALRRTEIEVKTLQRELCETRQTLLTEKIERIEKDVQFTATDLQAGIQDLSRYATELKRKLKSAESRLHQVEGKQAAALATLKDEQADQEVVDAELETWQAARRGAHEEITIINQRLSEVSSLKHYWNCRYEVMHGTATRDQIEEWSDDLEGFLEQLDDASRSLALRVETLRVDQATLFRRTHSSEREQIQKSYQTQSSHLDRLVELCETSLLQLKSYERSVGRFAEDLENKLEPDESSRWLSQAGETVGELWNYEIASVDDHPITVNKIVTAIGYLLLGLVAARVISSVIGKRVLRRFGLNEGAAHAIQSITFYSLCILFGFLSLQMVNLPLTAFTFLGGAAAIGLGFGSQNIVNNFFSGLILLAEQPIRVGDLVVVEGVQGTVEKIGARSTRVRTAANHELIVPNSTLLENKVTNLTLSDDLVQTGISVTLNKLLPIDQARRTLMQAAAAHSNVLADPAPVVLFKESSATSMSFELHFWMALHDPTLGKIVESDIRESINNLFDSAGAGGTALGSATSPARRDTATRPRAA